MEIPLLSKRQSSRPRSPADTELLPQLRGRYSRAYGVFGTVKSDLQDRDIGDRRLREFCKNDTIGEIVEALATDEHREFFEREFGMVLRLTPGDDPVLHYASPEASQKLDAELRRAYDRRSSDRAYAFAIGAIRAVSGAYMRHHRRSGSWIAPPVQGDAKLFAELLAFMSDSAARADLERQVGCRIRFRPPDRLLFLP